MDPETNKNKPLTKEETKGLLSLIERSKIINNKKTNAASNKMKVEEWLNITNEFNATVGTCRRNHQQLRLKWENLKKNSRKRSTLLRMDRIKTGGGPPGYFPPDEILDRVASLLGSTGEGFTVMFGGDAEPQNFDGGDEIPTPMLLVDNSVSTNVASTSSMTTYEDPIGNDMHW